MSQLAPLLPLLVVAALFWVMLIRPQQRRQRAINTLQDSELSLRGHKIPAIDNLGVTKVRPLASRVVHLLQRDPNRTSTTR